jgi:hypothetical protein
MRKEEGRGDLIQMKRRSQSARRKVARRVRTRIPRVPRSRHAKALDLAVQQLNQAVNVTTSKADAVLAASEAIVQLAAARAKSELVSALLEHEVLTALYGIPESDGAKSALRLLSRWLREQLQLEPIYERGQILEIPESRLSTFELIDNSGHSTGDILAVRIVSGGWKHGNKVLRKPVASLSDGTMAETIT